MNNNRISIFIILCNTGVAPAIIRYVHTLSDDIVYIPADELSNIIKNGEAVSSFSVPLVSDEEITSINGTFTYSGSEMLSVGDTLCVYSGTLPDTEADTEAFLDESIAYVEVTGINGSTVSYMQASAENVLALPDTLPIYVGNGSLYAGYSPAGTSFTVDAEDVDFSQYTSVGLDAQTTIDTGDYLFFYASPDFVNLSEDDVLGYAVVTRIEDAEDSDASITVTYETVTQEDMQDDMHYYARTPVSGEILLEDTDVAQLQESLEQQAVSSGFAREAALYLCAVTMATDSFEGTTGESLDYSSAVGTLSSDSVSLMSFADEIQVDVSASIGTNTQKIGSDGVRAAVTVSFEAPISVGDNDMVISGSATFVQELSVSIDASGSCVWDHWWIFYWISDYNVYTYTNVYNYTGMFVEASIRTQGGGISLDVSDEIQTLLTSTDSEEIVSGISDLLDEYCGLMENDADWIELFEQNLFDKRIPVLFGVIKISGDFVVSAYINMSMGTSFEYSNGTCYAFYGRILSRNFSSYTQDLADEVFTFRFYVLGELGIRAGIRLELAVGLFNCDIDSVGFTAEAGVYAKLYGYFYYEYKEVNDVSSTLSTGALYFELGCYLEINFVAQACYGSFSSSWTLYENEWPLLFAGEQCSVVDFAVEDTPQIRLKYENTTFSIPNSFRTMKYLDLKEGAYSESLYPLSDFTVTFSNSAFSLSGDTITVTPATGDRRVSCDMTITWRHGAMALSSLPISRTYHIEWDNIDDSGYWINFESNGGSYISPINALYEADISEPTLPSRTGYVFAGWYSDSALTLEYTFSTMPAENITLYAKWTPSANTAYTVYHYKQDIANESSYTLADTERLTGTTGSSVMPGVKTYEGFTSPFLRTLTIAPDGSSTVSYYYIRNTYTARFIAEGNESGTAQSILTALLALNTILRQSLYFL